MLFPALVFATLFAPEASDQPAAPAEETPAATEAPAATDTAAAPEAGQPAADESTTATVDSTVAPADDAPSVEATSSVGPQPAPEPPPVEDDPDPPPPPPEEEKLRPTFHPGVQAFLRGEGRINPDFESGGGACIRCQADQGAVLQRVRLQALAIWGPVSGFAQVQDARSWGFEASTASNDANTDLHQGYMELGGGDDRMSGFVRAGRQEILIGQQRLIGPLAWMPNARSFDALRIHGQFGKFSLDVFGVMLQPPGVVTAPDPMDPSNPPLTEDSAGGQLAGGLFAAKVHKAFNGEVLGLYVREGAKNNALAFDRKIGNAGLHVFGEPVDGLTYDAEGNVQVGTFNTRDHFAWAWAGKVKYVYKKPKVKPGAHVGYAMASGESCTNDPSAGMGCGAADSSEFFNFYPTNHIHYGLVDRLGWRNMRDFEVSAMVAIPPIAKVISVTYHYFQLNVPDGRWSNAGGANIGSGWDPDNTNRNLGHEIDVIAVLKPWEPLFIQPGYGVFIPVGAGKNIGGPDPQHYLWLWLVATFG